MIRLLVAGACGKMAGRVMALASQDSAFKVTAAFDLKGHPLIGKDLGTLLGLEGLDIRVAGGIEQVIDKGDILIDFTHAEAVPVHVRTCVERGKGMVIGTTGLSEAALADIKKASEKVPVVQSPNMSAGMNLLFRMAELAASKLGEEYDVEIVESHHRHKKDSPSGSALELARRVASGRKIDLDPSVVYGRKGVTGERKKGSIGIHAVRGGDVVGDHILSFMSEGERLEFIHRASSRDAFAKGALLAAKFISRKKSGLFTMQDVLGL